MKKVLPGRLLMPSFELQASPSSLLPTGSLLVLCNEGRARCSSEHYRPFLETP